MKVLYVYRDFFMKGGVPYEARSLVKSVCKKGVDAGVIYQKEEIDIKDFSKDLNITYLKVDNSLRDINKIKNFIRNFKPNIVHFFSLWIPFHNIVGKLVISENIPYIISLHGTLNPYMLEKRFGYKGKDSLYKYLKILYRKIFDVHFLKKASFLHALSKYEENLANIINSNTFIAPNGIDEDWLKTNIIDNLEENNKKELVFLYLGRIDIFQKGLDLIINAFVKLNNNNKYSDKFKLIIAGPDVGNNVNKLKQLILKKNAKNIIISGPVYGSDKIELFNSVDYFLHLSRFEGMARAVREAVAYGIPVISSYESNFGDWVDMYKIGITVKLNENDLYNKLIGIIDNNNYNKRELRNNIEKFSLQYTWSKVGEIFLNYYNKL